MRKISGKSVRALSVALACTGAVMLSAGIGLLVAAAPAAAQEGALVAPGCKQVQRIVYSRCGHEVLRRLDAPAEWTGMTRERAEAALAETGGAWRMTAFTPRKIELTQSRDLFCPAHWVLMMDDSGETGVYRCMDGETMTRLSACGVPAPDEETRARLRHGVAFDSESALRGAVEALRETD